MTRRALLAGLLFAPALFGQFEVAAIRPSTAAPGSGTSFQVFEGGRLEIRNEPVKLLLRVAFQLPDAQIAGAPDWVETDRYDLDAKSGRPEKMAPDQMAPLLANLLAERFHLKFHREKRELTVGALVVAKGGPKLKPAADGEPGGMNTSQRQHQSELIARAASMDQLAMYVGNRLGRIVVDQTGLTGSYDFTLTWSPDETPIPALRDQLGLSLETRKSPVDVLVIDHIERPSGN